jgi:hypothetical protein
MKHAPNCAIAEKLSEDCSCRPPTVWLINQPLKWVDEKLVRWQPLETLENFGKVVSILPDGSPPAFLDGYMTILREKLSEWRDGDFLACSGDLTLLAAAGIIIGGIVGGKGQIRTLKWSKKHQSYELAVLNLGESARPAPTSALTSSTLTGDDQ